MEKLELAWSAGFFDGEGWVGVRVEKYPRLMIRQVSPLVLYRFQKAMGGIGNITGPYVQLSNSTTPVWQYQVDGLNKVQHVICCMWNWLSPVKREQAKNTLLKVRVA